MLIYLCHDLLIGSDLIGMPGLYINFLFFLIAIFLYFYSKRITLDNEEIITDFHEPAANAYSDQWIIDNISQILCIKDAQGHWLFASKSFLKLLNIAPDTFQGKTDKELSLHSPQLKQILLKSYQHDVSAWDKRESVSRITELPGKDGNDSITIKLTKTPIYNPQGERFKLITSGSEITPGEQKQTALQLAAYVFEQNIKCMLILDLRFNIIQINSALANVIGFSSRQIKKQPLSFLNEQDIDKLFIESIHKQIQSQQFWEGEIYCSRKNSAPFPTKLNIAPVMSRSKGTIKHYIAILTDLSEQKTADKQMERLAHYDSLTELPNRMMFLERLNQVLTNAHNQNKHVVLLFIDLDKFKTVNDTIGHRAGDTLLKEVATRLSESIRKNDLVARLSGDEFAVLLDNINTYEDAYKTATIISEKILKLLTKAFHIQRKEILIGASIGIAIYPEDANNSQNLLKHSDIAMYAAKENGRNNYQFFKKDHISKLHTIHQLETDLRTALERQEFKLFYQPQFDANTNDMVGTEALLRWFKNYKTLIPPNDFIAIAEENGLIIPLGEWVLETACRQQKNWLDAGYNVNRISVNISERQLFEENFITSVEKILAKTELNPKHLEFEITESMLMGDFDSVNNHLQRIHAMGISLAIDDFGTGYSSLPYLKDFPVNTLKIDQSFLKNIPGNAKDIDIVCTIIEMGHSLGLKIVAEGVETIEQLEFLKSNGCDSIQGFLLGEPIEAEAMASLLQKTASNPTTITVE